MLSGQRVSSDWDHGNFFKDSVNFLDKFWVFIQGAKVELDASIIHPNFYATIIRKITIAQLLLNSF